MKVYFIGAGPGAADLLTVRGAKLIKKAKMVMYAGSLVSPDMLKYCKKKTTIINTAELNLEEQMVCYAKAKKKNWDVARLHSGDPAIYGATAEQMRRLKQMDIPYQVVPGVSSFSASAAILNAELTKPKVSQTIILTRASGRASSVPKRESIAQLAAHQATLCIFLSGPHLKKMVGDLLLHYPPNTPIALVHKASWPQEKVHQSTLEKVVDEVNPKDWALSTMILVGETLSSELLEESRLYSEHYTHIHRKASKKQKEKTT